MGVSNPLDDRAEPRLCMVIPQVGKPIYNRTLYQILILQVIKEIKPKSKDGIGGKNESQMDTTGVENKENTEGSNKNSFIQYNSVDDGIIPGLDLVNESEHSSGEKVNGSAGVGDDNNRDSK